MLLIRVHSLLKHVHWGLALIFFMLVISACTSNRGYEIYVEKRIVKEKAAWESAINEDSELAYRRYIKQFNSRLTASYGWHHPVHLRMAEISLDYWLAKTSRSVKDAQMLLKDERFVYLRKNITDPDDKIQFDRINSLSNDLAMNSLAELLRSANSVFIDIKYNEKSPDMLLNQALEKQIRETVIQVVTNEKGYLKPSNDANTADFTLSIYFKAKPLSSLYRPAHNSNTTRRYTGLDLFLKSHIDWQGFKRFSNQRTFSVEPTGRISTSALSFYRGGDTETTRQAIARINTKPEDAVSAYPNLEVSNYFEKLLSEALGFAGDDDIRYYSYAPTTALECVKFLKSISRKLGKVPANALSENSKKSTKYLALFYPFFAVTQVESCNIDTSGMGEIVFQYGYFPQNPHTAYKKDASPETIINRARATVSQEFGVKKISPLAGESILLLNNQNQLNQFRNF